MSDSTANQDSSVTVIIPTLNGAAMLRELLAALSIQTVRPDEVLVVDSQSTDGSAEIARQYGAHVCTIERTAFDHGATRSMAARKATGDILVFFTQDVIPAHRAVVEQLIAPLFAHNSVALSYGRQLPAFDADDIAAHLRRFNYPDSSRQKTISDRDELGFETVFHSNSCAAYVKKSLAELGFFKSGLIFGEDTCAAGRFLENGMDIAYVAEAAVYHSHNYLWHEEFRRYFDIGVFHTCEDWLLSTYGTTGSRGKQYVSSGLAYLRHRRRYGLIVDFMVRVGLKYIGYHLGRNYRKLPRRILPTLSMNRNYWKSDSEPSPLNRRDR